MIKKIFRLKENEVKKVLSKSKPFFSYGIVLNSMQNKVPYNRFAIVIGAKSVNNNITRNFFRRRFYDFVSSLKKPEGTRENLKPYNSKLETNYDHVFVVKSQTKLDKKDEKSIISFEKDLSFLIKKAIV